MSTATPLPSGITPPYTIISDTNGSGLIAILAGFALGLTLLSAGIRLYPRHNVYAYRWDDWTFHAATIIAIIQSSLVFEQIAQGLGHEINDISSSALRKIRRLNLISDLLYILTLAFSKASCAFFLLWVTPYKLHRKCVWFLIISISVFGVTSLFTEGFRCPPSHSEDFSPLQCTGFFGRWVYIGTFDIITEVALIITSIYLIWGRQMALKNKAVVVGAFMCRTPNAILAILRLIFLNDSFTPQESDEWTARVVCTTQIAIGYTIASCVIPYLGPFMQVYEREPDQRLSSDRSYSKQSYKSSSTVTGMTAPLSEYHFTSARSKQSMEEWNLEREIERDLERELKTKRDLRRKESGIWKGAGDGLGGELVVTKTVDWSVSYDVKANGESKESMEGVERLNDGRKKNVVVFQNRRQGDGDDIQPVAPGDGIERSETFA